MIGAIASADARIRFRRVSTVVAFLILTIAVARLLPAVLRVLHSEHDLFLIVSVAAGLALAGVGSAVNDATRPAVLANLSLTSSRR